MGDKKNHYRKYVTRICERCGKEYTQRSDYKSKFCGYECYWESMKKDRTKTCPICGKTFNKLGASTYCSLKCMYTSRRGENHPLWNGGISKDDGYIRQRVDCKLVQQHRKVMEDYLGRKLRPDEIVHHKDHNRANNDISNLEVMTRSEHSRLHAREKWEKQKQKGIKGVWVKLPEEE